MLPKLYHLGSALPRQLYCRWQCLTQTLPNEDGCLKYNATGNAEAIAWQEASVRWQNKSYWRRSETATKLHRSGGKAESGRVHRGHRASSQPRRQVATKYPNPSGAPRHWRWRTRVNRSEALGQARAEGLTLVPCVADFTPLQNESLPPCQDDCKVHEEGLQG